MTYSFKHIGSWPPLLGPIAVWANSAMILLAPAPVALVASSLCPGQEKRTIHKPEVQIGNSGSNQFNEEEACPYVERVC